MTSGGDSGFTVEDEAAAWAARIDAAPSAAHPGLEEWLKADPARAGALLRAQAALAMLGGGSLEDTRAPSETTKPAEDAGSVPRKRWRWLAGAVGLAASLAALAFLDLPRDETFEADRGEVRALALRDGSAVSVDAGSRVDVRIGKDTRVTRLVRGKALFHVAHDPGKPFRVIVGDVTITDIGTVFQVTDDAEAGFVDVLVSEGAVDVEAGGARTRLVAGNRARFPRAASKAPVSPIQTMSAAAMDRALGWTSGQLELDGEPIGEAVSEMNRHNHLQVRLADPARLAGEPLYGAFRLNDPIGFARAVAASVEGTATIHEDGIVISAP
ncbi:iron dicitrate transport regulator FecR [Novosphingobium sp. NBM11]|uniref:FecR family protein n=1 Tax=Novosphingobium sp. NBM11 TaxID=2596914 RepID=UPI001892406C|nr:FecR domain-containing protein [Novosphingobium sp. NBM11]MBF5093033.1 iron dicitrate transport regulator FecR [Novosphingobium sp. NBM11]